MAQFGAADYFSTYLAPYATTDLAVWDLGADGTNPYELGQLLLNTASRGLVKSSAAIDFEATPLHIKP